MIKNMNILFVENIVICYVTLNTLHKGHHHAAEEPWMDQLEVEMECIQHPTSTTTTMGNKENLNVARLNLDDDNKYATRTTTTMEEK